ncbi:MAG: hypothetical protein KIT69_11605, partial [Propionibacteriaceae bacterium]|nr:hypothetical protein [Propionibacteriaceae bacterium]
MTALGNHELAGTTLGGIALRVAVVNDGRTRTVRVAGPDAAALAGFEGEASEFEGGSLLVGPLSPANAAALRAHVATLNPRPAGLSPSAGTGDRLGLST